MPVERVKITHPATGATSEVRAAAAAAWARSGWVLVDQAPKPKARRRRARPATPALDSQPPTAGDQDDSDAGSSTTTD